GPEPSHVRIRPAAVGCGSRPAGGGPDDAPGRGGGRAVRVAPWALPRDLRPRPRAPARRCLAGSRADLAGERPAPRFPRAVPCGPRVLVPAAGPLRRLPLEPRADAPRRARPARTVPGRVLRHRPPDAAFAH